MEWELRHEPPVVGTGALDTAYFADTIPESDDIVLSDCLAHKLRIVRPTAGGGLSVVRSLGGMGAGSGELRCPMGVACDGRGAVFVVDMGNRRIQRRSLSDGSVLSQYEARWGRGDGELRSPQGIALLDGLIYVCDTANNRIVCFEDDCTGFKFVRSCTPDEAFGRLHGPTDCAGYVDTDGSAQLFVTDRYNHRVVVLRPDHGEFGFVRQIGTPGRYGNERAGTLREPFGCAVVHPCGGPALAVSEYHGKRVQLFSMTGVAMIVVQPEDGLQFRMAGLVCSPTGARVRVIDPAKDCSDGLFECSLAPAADTSLQRRCLLALLSQCGDAAECDALLATLAEHSVGAALDHLELGQPGPVYRTVE